jgi:membrane fusion protein, multidrug efflux system
MKAAGEHRSSTRGRIIAIAVVTVAVVTGIYAWRTIATHPSTDDASIDADVVHVASLVGGRIIQIPVEENSSVASGDLLFQIDPLPYQLVLAQAEANLALAKGELDSRRRVLATEKANATIAGQQTVKARQNGELAARTVERLGPLASQGFVPTEQFDQAQVRQQDAETSLRQAEEQQSAASVAIGTQEAAEASVRARDAALGIARRELENTTVRAPHDGRVVGLSVVAGETVIPSQALFTLIDTEAWYVVGNFRETELKAIAPGDCVTAYSMIDRRQPIKGIVQGIGWGIVDQERINLPRSVPYVERSLNWVRVEQRFPVRVRLVNPPPALMRLGASAVVQIKHGAACR